MTATRAVLATGLAGQLAAASVGAIPWALLPVSAGLYAGAAWWAAHADDRRAAQLRKAGALLAVVVMLALAPSFPWPPEPQQLKEILGFMLLGVQVGQALSWRQDRDLRSGLLTALGMLVLGASYAPDILVGIPLLIGWAAALAALGRLQGARSVLPATALAVVLGLVAFLLVPVPVSATLRSRLAGISPAPTRDSAIRVFSGEELDLRQRGKLTKDPVATVPADSPTLWRSATFDHYDGTTWSRPKSSVLQGGPGYDVAAVAGPARTDRVTLTGSSDGTVWSPGRLVSIEASGVRIPLVNELGDVQLPGVRGGYSVTSDVLITDPARLRSTRGQDDTSRRWREVPEDLPDRVDALAREITRGASNRYDAAEAIAQWLRSEATYRLDSPVPAAGMDAVDQFLFVDKTGFCEQFASAEVVLLRTLGIPARLVTGLAYGVPAGPGLRSYRVADLHAWVELWVPGTGWVSSDPTAGVPLAESSSVIGTVRERVAAAVSATLQSLTRVPGGRPALAGVLLLITVLASLVVARRPRICRTPVVLPVVAGGPALRAFLRMDARQGSQARRPGESLRELSTRWDPGIAPALEVVERECYAPVSPDPGPAVDVLDRY